MGWTESSRELPPMNEIVVVCDDDGNIDLAWRDSDGWWRTFGFVMNCDYWYPIPKPPEIKNEMDQN